MTCGRVAAATILVLVLVLAAAAAGLLGPTGATSNGDWARPYRPAQERPARPASTPYLICAGGSRC